MISMPLRGMDDDEVARVFAFDKKFIHGGVPLAAVSLHGHRNLWRSGPRSADADDNRRQDAARRDGSPRHGFACPGSARRQRPRRRRTDQFRLTETQLFGGFTWPRISPAGFFSV